MAGAMVSLHCVLLFSSWAVIPAFLSVPSTAVVGTFASTPPAASQIRARHSPLGPDTLSSLPLRLRGGSIDHRHKPSAHKHAGGGAARPVSQAPRPQAPPHRPAPHGAGGGAPAAPPARGQPPSSWASIVGKQAAPAPKEEEEQRPQAPGGAHAPATVPPSAGGRAPAAAPAAAARGGSSFHPSPGKAERLLEHPHPTGRGRAAAAPATAVRASASPTTGESGEAAAGGAGQQAEAGGGAGEEDEDAYYFNSYSHFGIHEEMLKDEGRTHAYRDALLKNAHILKGKTVLDVGCGTGILSMFAAKAGAKHVYAVDNSEMAWTCKEIVRANGLEDTITVIKGDVESIELPVPQVDVIVSEWMGYSLLYEAMLDTVLWARDKWLAPDGVLMPDKASIYLTGIEDAKYKEEKIHFWDSVYGFNMSVVKAAALSEPLVDTVMPDQLATTTACVWEADLMTITKEELFVDTPFTLTALRNDYVHAIVAHFDVGFTMMHKPIWLSTGPRERPTHWRQSVVYLHDELAIRKGEEITGEIKMTPNRQNKRHLDYRLKYNFCGEAVNGVAGVNHSATHYYGMR